MFRFLPFKNNSYSAVRTMSSSSLVGLTSSSSFSALVLGRISSYTRTATCSPQIAVVASPSVINDFRHFSSTGMTLSSSTSSSSSSSSSVTPQNKKTKIETLEDELVELKGLLKPDISEIKEVAIRQEIGQLRQQIIELEKRENLNLGKQQQQQQYSSKNTLTTQFLNEKNFNGLEIKNLDYAPDSCLSYLLYNDNRSSDNPVAHRIVPKNTKEDPINIFIEGIKSLSDLLGKTCDKIKYYNLAVSGTSGQGKTQFLRYLQFFFDSVRPVDFVSNIIFSSTPSSSSTEFGPEKKEIFKRFYRIVNNNNNNNSSNNNNNQNLPPSVVLFATFNQGFASEFSETEDTSATIRARTVLRMFNEYFSTNFKYVASDVNFYDFVSFVRQFVAAKEDITDQKSIDKIPVILCVDELRKISIGETRVELLDKLASLQQGELQDGRPTFIIVSSLDLWPVENVWKTKSNREMTSIPLPELPVDKLKEFMFNMQTKNRTLWEEFVAASLDSCSGHARQLQYVVEALLKLKETTVDSEWKLPKPKTGISINESSNVIEAAWHVGLKQTIVGGDGARVRYEDASDLAKLTTKDAVIVDCRDCLLKLLDNGFFFIKADVNNFGDLFLKPISRYIAEFSFTGQSDFYIHEWLKGLWAATRELRVEVVQKDWEIAMISALFLHARARFDVCSRNSRFDKLLVVYQESDTTIASPRGPSLGEVLDFNSSSSSSKTEFYNENVKKFILPVGKCLSLKKVEEELWSDEADDTFCRYSTKSNQPAIEGTIELEDQKGERVIGYVQMKFLKQGDLQPRVAADVIEKIIIFHNRSRNSCKKFCILLFGSGDSQELSMSNIKKNLKQGCFREDDILEKLNFVLIGAETCTKLLEPFGSSVLIKKLERRSAKKKKDEKERK